MDQEPKLETLNQMVEAIKVLWQRVKELEDKE